jgi:hypothetical protein
MIGRATSSCDFLSISQTSFFRFWTSRNYTNYCNKDIEKLFDEQSQETSRPLRPNDGQGKEVAIVARQPRQQTCP